MPAYGQRLTPAEVTALVAFLETLDEHERVPPGTEGTPKAPEEGPAVAARGD